MFQVPGWSISAPLKVQNEAPPSKAANGDANTETAVSTKQKKRKRRSKQNGTNPEDQHDQETKKQKATIENSEDKNSAPAIAAKRVASTQSTVNPRHATYGNSQHQAHVKNPSMSKLDMPNVNTENSNDSAPKTRNGNGVELNTAKPVVQSSDPASNMTGTMLTPMQRAMRDKLTGARFRHLNQSMYTSKSKDNLKLFNRNPDMWKDYHEGFAQQVQSWPENPIDGFIQDTRTRIAIRSTDSDKGRSLPRGQGHCTIVDMGCGDAKFANAFRNDHKKLKLSIRSFDLNSSIPGVETADSASLPLTDGSVNVVLICLALMGTNWVDFIDEAFRILHWKGELWIAEIKSRFVRGDAAKGKVVDHSVGKRKKRPTDQKDREQTEREEERTLSRVVDGDGKEKEQTDVSAFIQVLEARGFRIAGSPEESIDMDNKMFVKFRFIKAANPSKGSHVKRDSLKKGQWLDKAEKDEGGDDNLVLKPCLYKVR